jgi:CubicO group peptidase (beta-lactamase class C family)
MRTGKRSAAGAVFAAILTIAAPAGAGADEAPVDVGPTLQAIRAEAGIPAVATAITRSGRVRAAGIAGRRRADRDDPAEIGDRFHIGSDTKATTAFVAASLIEGRSPIPLRPGARLGWETTVGEVYPELVPTMVRGFRDITLRQLLSHTSGIAKDGDRILPFLGFDIAEGPLDTDEMRDRMVTKLVTMPLSHPPGETFEYANFGYILAGAMMERLTGVTFEELLVGVVFEPLGLGSAGLASQAEPARMDAAVGHDMRDGNPFPILFGPYAGLPPIMNPAGGAYMNVLDFARWADYQATRGRNGPPLLASETIAMLQTPIVDMPENPHPTPGFSKASRYGLGWGTLAADFAPEPLVLHAGSNSLDLAFIMLLPAEGVAIVTMADVEAETTAAALVKVAAELYATDAKAPRRPTRVTNAAPSATRRPVGRGASWVARRSSRSPRS